MKPAGIRARGALLSSGSARLIRAPAAMSNLLAQQAGNALSSMAGAIDFSALVSAGKAVASSSKDLMGEAHYFEETVTVRALGGCGAGSFLLRRRARGRAVAAVAAPPFRPLASWVPLFGAPCEATAAIPPPAPPAPRSRRRLSTCWTTSSRRARPSRAFRTRPRA